MPDTDPRPRWSEGTATVQFRAGDLAPDLGARAGNRSSPSLVAKRDLERLYHLVDRELERLNLTEPEASLIVDALNGTLHAPHTVPLLAFGVTDALEHDGLATKWGVNASDLIDKLRALSPLQCLAVVDAAERAWRAIGDGAGRPLGEQLRAVGLARRPRPPRER